jgi:hypothetical protein
LDEQDKAILDYLQALHYTSDENFSLIILKQLETLGVISEFFSAQDLFEKGNNYLRNNDFPNAVSAYSEALEIFPLFYYVYVNRGMAYTNMFIEGGNEDYSSNAEADFTAAIELTPLDPNPYYLRGKLYSIRSESDLAISDFEKGLALGLRQEFEDDAKDLRPTRRARGRLDSHRQNGFFRGFGFCPFRGRVSSLQPPVTRAVGRPTRRARGRLDSHRQIGFFRGFGFCPFRGRVSSLQPPVTRAVRPNTACTRTAGFSPPNWLFRGFGFCPFRGRVSSRQPPVTRAVSLHSMLT